MGRPKQDWWWDYITLKVYFMIAALVLSVGCGAWFYETHHVAIAGIDIPKWLFLVTSALLGLRVSHSFMRGFLYSD